MDPSYNDAFGNAGAAGGMNAGGVVGSGNAGMNAGGVGSGDVNGMNASGIMGSDGVMSSDTTGQGDIVINSDDGARKRKILLIVLAVLVGLIVIAGIIFAIVMSGAGQGSGRSGASNYRDAFNIYANYFVYGEQSKNDIDIEEMVGEDETTFYQVIMKGGDGQYEYMDKLKELYTDFFELYVSVYPEQSSIQYTLYNYMDKLNIVTNYYTGAHLNQLEVFDLYSTKGRDGAMEAIKEKFSAYEALDDVYGISYYGLAIDWGNQVVLLAEEYNKFGCAVTGAFDDTCAVAFSDGAGTEISRKISNYGMMMRNILDGCEKELYDKIPEIDNAIDYELEEDGNE